MLLVADLAECEIEIGEAELLIFSNRFLLKSVVDLIASTDLDLQEKVSFCKSVILVVCFWKVYFYMVLRAEGMIIS